MNTPFLRFGRYLAAAALLSFGVARMANGAQPPGFVPNQPAIWCRFDGNAQNFGSGYAQWYLQNVAYQENTLYLNGKYAVPNKQDGDGFQATCTFDRFAKDRFTVAIRFKRDLDGEGRIVLMGGKLYRWFGIEVTTSGGLGLTFNNGRVAVPLSGIEMRPEGWNWLVCSVNIPAKTCTAFLNGNAAAPVALPADLELNVAPPVEQRDNYWTFSNYGNGRTFCGWVDEFMFYPRELAAAEVAGLAHRPEMLDPRQPALITPPKSITALNPKGNAPAARSAPLSPADLAEHPGKLAIDSVGGAFALAGRFSGQYTWNAAHVKVHIKSGEIVRQAKGNAPERDVKGFQLFVRRENPALHYMDIVARSEIVPVDASITHGQSVLAEDIDVELPLRNLSAADAGKLIVGVFIYDTPAVAKDAPALAPGTPQREQMSVAEASTLLNGTAKAPPIKLGKN